MQWTIRVYRPVARLVFHHVEGIHRCARRPHWREVSVVCKVVEVSKLDFFSVANIVHFTIVIVSASCGGEKISRGAVHASFLIAWCLAIFITATKASALVKLSVFPSCEAIV